MSEVLASSIPLVIIVGVVVVLVFLARNALKKREFLHRERMAAIEKGLEVPKALLSDVPSPDACHLRGMVWLFAGIGTVVFFLAMAVSEGDSELFGVSSIGLIPCGIGVAYLICSRKARP